MIRVYLKRLPSRNGGTIQRWFAENMQRDLYGVGRTRREAIRNMSSAYQMDFDSTAWKVRYDFGTTVTREALVRGKALIR